MNSFLEISREILEDEIIEGQYIDIKSEHYIRTLLNDYQFVKRIYKPFYDNLINNCSIDEMYMKVQDCLYRLDMLISKVLIKKYNINDYEDIKDKIEKLIDDNIDLYSAVSYDSSDNEIIEEFYSMISEDIKI